MTKKVIVIGSGFSSLAGATTLADKGFDVTVLEKNDSLGGRARVYKEAGFTFDMGPSWYWMPDVFDDYFSFFGKKTSDYYELVRLDPSYKVVFGQNDEVKLPANLEQFKALFESMEKGSSKQLDNFLSQAKYKYDVGMTDFVHKPSLSFTEFIDPKLAIGALKLDILKSFSTHIRKFFKNDKILKLIEFPVLFLGATPEKTPAMYSLMNYADIVLGTWYPLGGMFKVVDAMVSLAKEKGVKFKLDTNVSKIEVENGVAKKVITNQGVFDADIVLAGADYNHVETSLLANNEQSYSKSYWDQKVMSPSSLIFYLGINKKLANLEHHDLFFDTDFALHAEEIYEKPSWPSSPLFYVSVASKTDKTVAPEGCENMVILIPLAPDLEDTEEIREKYYHIIMDRLEKLTNQEIRSHVILKKSYAHKDFKHDYNAFKGNAYGLSNILKQTAIFKPSIKSKKVSNLFYTGQLTVPGPGVPPAIISGQVVAKQIMKEFA